MPLKIARCSGRRAANQDAASADGIRYTQARARFTRQRTTEALASFEAQLEREWAWLYHMRQAAKARPMQHKVRLPGGGGGE
jgi:hypothetical protein